MSDANNTQLLAALARKLYSGEKTVRLEANEQVHTRDCFFGDEQTVVKADTLGWLNIVEKQCDCWIPANLDQLTPMKAKWQLSTIAALTELTDAGVRIATEPVLCFYWRQLRELQVAVENRKGLPSDNLWDDASWQQWKQIVLRRLASHSPSVWDKKRGSAVVYAVQMPGVNLGNNLPQVQADPELHSTLTRHYKSGYSVFAVNTETLTHLENRFLIRLGTTQGDDSHAVFDTTASLIENRSDSRQWPQMLEVARGLHA